MIFVFTIWLSGEIPAQYQACIDSYKAIYPNMVIVKDWGDCPLEQTGDARRDSEKLRRWILSRHEEALYSDADVMHKQKLTFDKTDKPWFGADEKGVDEWLVYHKGQQEAFKELLRQPVMPPHYEISGNDKFVHLGLTMSKGM